MREFKVAGITHTLSRTEGGEGIESWIRPVCSCGWNGRPEHAYSSSRFSNLTDQEDAHEDATIQSPNWWETAARRTQAQRDDAMGEKGGDGDA